MVRLLLKILFYFLYLLFIIGTQIALSFCFANVFKYILQFNNFFSFVDIITINFLKELLNKPYLIANLIIIVDYCSTTFMLYTGL